MRTLKGARETTVAAALVIDLIRYLEQIGIPATRVYTELQLDPSALARPNARLAGSLMEKTWDLSSRLAKDSDIGLHCAENFNPGALNILGYVLLSCRSASEALGRLAQYAALLNDGMRVRVTTEKDRTQAYFDVVPNCDNYLARSPRHAIETMAVGTLITMRRLTTVQVEALTVSFQHASPPNAAEHLRIFGPIVKFGEPENLIEFRTADLGRNLLSANPVLLEMFDGQAQQLLGHLDHTEQRGPVSRRVLAILAKRITVTVPSLDEIAGELAMSERTIQRELRAENTTYRQLIEDMRKEIAMQHLAQPGASASEAAFLLGFSEPSAFTRAFRRWTGSAPTEYRAV